MNRFDEAMDTYCEAIDLITNRCEQSVKFFKSDRYMGFEAIERECGDAINLRVERLSYMYYDIAHSYMLRGDFSGSIKDYRTVLTYVEKSWKLKYDSNTQNLKKLIEDRISELKAPKYVHKNRNSNSSVKRNSVKFSPILEKTCNDPKLNSAIFNMFLMERKYDNMQRMRKT